MRRRELLVGKISRKPNPAQLAGNSQTSEDFHRTGRDLIALGARWIVGRPAFGNGDIDAARGKVQGERQTDRPGADNQNLGFKHAIPTCKFKRDCLFRASVARRLKASLRMSALG